MWFRSLLDAVFARSSRTPSRKQRPAPSIRQRPRFVHPRLEILEDRTLLSTYVVDSLTDTGAGSGLAGDLRYCVTNATSGSDTITFAPGLTGTISLQSALPTLNASVAIQGPGAQVITVDGGRSNAYGFTVDSAADVQIAGLTMNYCDTDIKAGSATISNCTVDVSAVFTASATVNTGTALTVSNCTLNGDSIYNDVKGAALTVSNCTASNGVITNYAAGDSATISYTTLSGCHIENDTLASETISYSTISGYTDNGSGAPPDADGAIQNSGNLTIDNSTISGNKAVGGAAYWVPTYSGAFTYSGGNGMGGALYNSAGTLTINSSTIADNEAIGGSSAGIDFAGSGMGGGLYIGGGTVSINNSTFADNQVIGGAGGGTGYGGGIYNAVGPSALQMHDTIVADNTADVGADLYGSVTSLGHNLIGNTTGGSGFVASDLVNVNPQLGPLQNNGGPTQTMALLTGSPALNAGDNTNAPADDQRGPGFPRIGGGTIDIGAFEVQSGSTNQASSLTVSGFPSTLMAGNAGTFTVTALNPDGSTDTGYTGTVHFTSSDPQAVLPANATLVNGVGQFSATLKTAGTQSLTATDNSGLSGSDTGIVVTSAAASTLSVSSLPSPTTAGVAHNVTVTLRDPYGNIASGYTGTVHFTSSDAKAGLPADYTFTAADAGTHTFSVTLKTAGTQSIQATDTSAAGLSGTDGGIRVNPAAASRFVLTAPSSVHAGAPFGLTVTVEDAYGNVVGGYGGTIHFSSTDSRATLPRNYTFTASDNGVHTFTGLVLRRRGNQKITVADTHNSALTGNTIVDVL